MKTNEILQESRGLLFRTPGEMWKNELGDEIRLKEIIRFPEAGTATPDELDQALEERTKELQDANVEEITPLNNRSTVTKAFAIAVFDGPGPEQQIAFFKWLTKIDPLAKGQWDNNDMGGYRYQGKKSLKSSSGLKPANLLTPGRKYANPRAILNDIKGKIPDSIFEGLETLIKSKKFFFAIDPSLETSLRDDFGEIISPIMLWQGQIPEAETARQSLLGDKPWSSCKISFPTVVNAGLVDSEMIVSDGTTVGISSKGGHGAKASVSNIANVIKELEEYNNPLLKTAGVKRLKQITDVLMNNSSKISPLILGIEMGLITEEQSVAIQGAMEAEYFQGDTPVQQYKASLKAGRLKSDNKAMSKKDELLNQLDNGPIAIGSTIKTSDLYLAKNRNPGYRIGFHALTIVAHAVTKEINNDHSIGKAALKVLNHAAYVQVHLHTSYQKTEGQKGVVLKKFDIVFPMHFQGRVKLSTEKAYWSSGQQGRMTFKYERD